MNKKAVTPLVSTILLIGFAGALGAIVMSWGASNYSDIQDAHIETCDDADIKAVDMDGAPLVCKRANSIEFTLQNSGNMVINGLKLVLLGTENMDNIELNNLIYIGDVLIEKINFKNR